MAGVIVSQKVALQRAAGILHDRQRFAVQFPGSESHLQCTKAICIPFMTTFAQSAILAQVHLCLSVAHCNQDERRCNAVCFV